VLDAARGAGYDVTVIAIKDEAFPPGLRVATAAVAALHGSPFGQLGPCIKLLKLAVSRKP